MVTDNPRHHAIEEPEDDGPKLIRLPRHGESMENEGIIIEWDYPKPEPVVVWKPNRQNWHRRLTPLKNTPGRRARVLRNLTKVNAQARWQTIQNSLWERDPKSKWKIESAKADDGTYGIWVTYEGVYSEDEFKERVALRAYRSRRSKLQRLNYQQRKALKRSLLNPTLKPPVVRPED